MIVLWWPDLINIFIWRCYGLVCTRCPMCNPLLCFSWWPSTFQGSPISATSALPSPSSTSWSLAWSVFSPGSGLSSVYLVSPRHTAPSANSNTTGSQPFSRYKDNFSLLLVRWILTLLSQKYTPFWHKNMGLEVLNTQFNELSKDL